MTYLFSNPQIKKWKTMFFLSFLFNIILITTFVLRECEVEREQKYVEGVENGADIAGEKKSGDEKPLSVVHMDDVSGERALKVGDIIVQSITVVDNFYSAFNRSEDVEKVAEKLEIPSLADLLGAHLARLLVWDLKLRNDVRKGDTCVYAFRVIPEDERRERDDLPDLIEIVALNYHSKKLGKDIKIFNFTPNSSRFSAFYYETGVMVEKKIYPIAPIKGYIQVTSKIADRAPRHDGIDFKAPVGTPVFSTVDGTVSRTNWMTRYNGYCIEIKEKDKPFTYKYLHLSDVLVKPGQKVRAGDHIANSGNTGKTTAPHLHYQINIGQRGDVINPFEHHQVKSVKLEGEDMGSFREKIAEIESMIASKR